MPRDEVRVVLGNQPGGEYYFFAIAGFDEAAGGAATRTAVPVMRESDALTMTLSDLAPAPLPPLLQRVCKICCCRMGGDAYPLF
jgi:hypothetical protein